MRRVTQRADAWLSGVRRGSVGVRRVTQRGDAWLRGGEVWLSCGEACDSEG